MQAMQTIDPDFTGFLAPKLKAIGYGLLGVRMAAGGRYRTMQIMAGRLDGKSMTVQDCVAISRVVGEQLENMGLAPDAVTLEVSALGDDWPLVRVEDFERFTGRTAVVEMKAPSGGRQSFKGRIVRIRKRAKGNELVLKTARGPVRLPVDRIKGAHLSEKHAEIISAPEEKITQ